MMTPDHQEADFPSGLTVARQLGDWSREIARTLGPDGKQCGSEHLERVAALSLASLNLSAISFLGLLATLSPPATPAAEKEATPAE